MQKRPSRGIGWAAVGALCCAALLAGAVGQQYEAGRSTSTDKGQFKWPNDKRAAVSLTFDDARASQLDVGLPIFDRHGVKVTFYVNAGNVEKRLADWKRAVDGGHEIGNHTNTHPCSINFDWSRHNALENYSLESMAREIDEANRSIEALLGILPSSFAFPCGQTYVGRGVETRSYIPLVAERFLSGRGWLDEGMNEPVRCDLAQLMGTELDGLSFQQARSLIEQAASEGKWLILCGHDIGETGRQTSLSSTLDAICRFAIDPANGVWIDRVDSVAEYVSKRRTAAD